jgi:hypothetical protein
MVLHPITPGVYEEVAPPPPPDPIVRDDIAAFVGLARRGPVDRAIRLEAWEEFVAWFGARADGFLLADAVLAFFQNGGRICWVVRVLHRAESTPGSGEEVAAPAAAVCRALQTGLPLANPAWVAAQFDVDDPGTWADGMAVALRFRVHDLRLLPGFLVDPVTVVVSGGRGEVRVVAGTLLWIRDGATDQFAVVAAVNDAVDTLGEDVGPRLTLHLEPPAAVTTTARIAVVEASVEALTALGLRERHDQLGLAPAHPRYLPDVLKQASRLVTLRPAGGVLLPIGLAAAEDGASPPDALAIAALAGGKDGLVSFQRPDFFDDLPDDERPERNVGVQQLDRLTDISIVVVPDLVLPGDPPPPPVPAAIVPQPSNKRAKFVCGEPPPPPTIPSPESPPLLPRPEELIDPEVAPAALKITRRRSLALAEDRLIAWCEGHGDRVVLLAPSPSLDPHRAVQWRRRIDSAFAATYYPWLQFGDPIAQPPVRPAPPTGVAAGIIARAERAFGVGRAPANFEASMVVGPDRSIDGDGWALLHGTSMNVFRPLPARGVRLLGARTLSSDRDFRYLHVRRLITHIVRRLQRRMVWAAFEPHTASLRERVRRDVEAYILRPLFQRGAFAGDSPKTSYFVRCDDTLNPRSSQELGRLIAEVGVAPNIPAEFLVLRLETSRERGIDIVERS